VSKIKARYVLQVPIDQEMTTALETRADDLGITMAALARTWIAEHLGMVNDIPAAGRPRKASEVDCLYCHEVTSLADGVRISEGKHENKWVHLKCYEQAKYILPA
jgi:hypothetical protein